jgi:cytochrome c553
MRNLTLLVGTCLTAAAGFALGAAVPTTQPNTAIVTNAPALTPEQTQFFETKVRPILTDRCYKCHSIEQAKTKGGLTLDTRDGWMKGGENGAVIVPGNSDESKLIKAIKYEDPDLQMPPKGEKLSDQEIASLSEWIKMGAPDPRISNSGGKLTGLNDKARAHWAYQPVQDPPVPDVKDKAWVRTPVDNFILAKLEAENIKPSHPAPRATLIRRAYYDLLGLPPTPREVETFVNDRSANAFEKVVDHLLESPHYGERWARFWLDSARYADTTGSDQVRRDDYRYAYAWTYRDYVIKSLNDDKPYDEFLKEQIAADLLPDASKHPESLAALGFLTVGKRFANVNDTIDERIDTLSKATLGLTVSCARCHDHKFDPIPQADYYSLHGVFSSIMEPEDKPLIGTKPAGTAYADYKHRLNELEQKNRALYFELIQQKSTEFREKADAYILAQLLGRRNRTPEALKERNKLIADYKLDRDVFGALRFNQEDRTVFAPLLWFFDVPPDEFSQQAPRVLERIANGGNANFRLNKRVMEAFASVSPNSLNSLRDVTRVYGKLFSEINDRALAYLKANRTATSDGPISGFDQDLIELANIPAPVEPAPRITTEHLREMIPKLPAVNNAYNRFVFSAINELELTHPGAPARAMVVQDLPRPHDDPIFIRGEAGNRGKIVPREFLEILSPKDRQPFKIGSGRLELAQDIANKDNPLTARVMINRIWMHHFGEGFVRTPDDLGVQSEPPSHPELLDYLASRFIEEGWSIKKMHKLIMLSDAYQQSSDTNNLYSQKDPENRLLWRANLRRLDFEAIRDTLLMFTGHLDPTIGGKPVNLTEEPYSFRRSIYGYIDRGALPELMGQFDFSDPDRANSRRTSTIVPQQALFFMNSPMSADVARKVCSRPEFQNAPNDEARVKALYEVLFQRPPRGAEVRYAMEFFYAHSGQRSGMRAAPAPRPQRVYQRPKNEAKRAIENEGEMVERRPLNLWEQYAQALLFTNEIAYVN